MKALLSWSSGKDSAMALLRARDRFDITGLLTTITEGVGRVSMHGVREELLDAQAKSLGLPLTKVPLPFPCPNAVYEERLLQAFAKAKAGGVTHILFGDLYLEDIRRYREALVARAGLEAAFPLWGADTRALCRELIAEGFRAVLTCVDGKKLPASFAGAKFDELLLRRLPEGVDPCGENGEFHTFVVEGPGFKKPIPVSLGERVAKQGFEFVDLLPA